MEKWEMKMARRKRQAKSARKTMPLGKLCMRRMNRVCSTAAAMVKMLEAAEIILRQKCADAGIDYDALTAQQVKRSRRR